MILYLDTNAVLSLLKGNKDEIDNNIRELLSDLRNILRTGSACVQEIIQLRQIGKAFDEKKRDKYKPFGLIFHRNYKN
ncbi:MAG: hypothetical protein LUC22_03630 [Prevotella sp.]|nr:hypothetical protein [Prevotella sp.]